MAQSSSYSQYLAAATEGKDFGEHQDAINELLAAAEDVEDESGYLTEDNEQGWSAYNKAVEVSQKRNTPALLNAHSLSVTSDLQLRAHPVTEAGLAL